MAGGREVTDLEVRKRALLLESQLNRLTLRAECGQLRDALSWAGCVKEAQRQLGPWLWGLAPVALSLLGRRLRGRSSGPGFWTRAFELGLGLVRLWRVWESSPKKKADAAE
jgi:hypothetical protein